MSKQNKLSVISDEVVMNKIYLIRNQKVMLDKDLAELYDVKSIRLREQVKRNPGRFPENFMFQLTENEVDTMVSQNAIPSKKYLGGHLPYVFTEHGVLMLANVLRSERAIKVSIRIIEIFIRTRELIEVNKEILKKVEQLEKKDSEQDEKIILIFEYIKQLEQTRQEELDFKKRKKIGYK